MDTSLLRSSLGLSKREAAVYATCLALGPCTISDLARRARLGRTGAYRPIASLLRQGLLAKRPSGKRALYAATDPRELRSLLDRRARDLDEFARQGAQAVGNARSGMDVRYFDGPDGMLAAADIFLAHQGNDTCRTIENPSRAHALTGTRRLAEYVDRRVRAGGPARCIINADASAAWLRDMRSRDAEQLRSTVEVSARTYPIEGSVAVAGEHVLIVSADDDVGALLIRSRALATTLSTLHRLAWDRFHPGESG